jgi:two-component system response regulator AtoC
MSILLIDDEIKVAEVITRLIKDMDDQIIIATNGKEGLAKVQQYAPRVIITDYKMPEMNGLEFVKAVNVFYPNIPIIVLTAHADKTNSLGFLKEGVFRFIEKPFDNEELKIAIKQAITRFKLLNDKEKLSTIIKLTTAPDLFVGRSKVMKQLFKHIKQVATTDETVLLQGESGTGKSLIAREIHQQSLRSSYPLIEFNCAAFNESLIESELFGHEKGAFTGADSLKPGRFELAHKGTIFLDEIGELSLAMQVKLLRVLQDGEFERVGGINTIKTNVRIITASNKDLEKLVEANKFRDDLFFRLNVFPLTVPPLRDREEDIALLANHFLKLLSHKYNKNIQGFSDDALISIKNYQWKGNVRELRNVISRAIIMCADDLITNDFISQFLHQKPKSAITENICKAIQNECTEDELVKLYAQEIYKKCHFNKKDTAAKLNVNYRTLMKRLS